MRTHLNLIVLVLSLGAAACGESAPNDPTWADVQPILMANCARCHGGENQIGGAPTSFRLDVAFDTTKPGTVNVRGAAAMADFIHARACEQGDMPPIGPHLSGRQCDILDDWAKSDPVCEETDPMHLCSRPDDTSPSAVLLAPAPGGMVGGTQPLTVFVDDADWDQVVGTLRWRSGEEGVIGPLHGGRNQLQWISRRAPVGTWSITAQITDVDPLNNPTHDFDLGAFTVTAAPAPFVSFSNQYADPTDPDITSQPLLDQLIHQGPGDPPFQIRFHVSDSTPATLAQIGPIAAVRSDERIEILAGPQPIVPGQVLQTVTWDTTDVPPGEWRIEVTISDGDPATTDRYRSEPFWVFHATTTVTCGDVEAMLEKNCATCHKQDSAHPISQGPDFTSCEGVRTIPGLVYRRVIQKREMPPRSQETLFGENPMTLDERATLQGWIEGGTP